MYASVTSLSFDPPGQALRPRAGGPPPDSEVVLAQPARAPLLLIAAGGTGGHVYPALAVADELRRRRPEADIVFAATCRGLETDLAGKAGYRVETVRVEPLRGGSLWRRLRGVAVLPLAALDAARLLWRLRPDAVLGVGGYLSGPLLATASLARFRTVLLEPNVVPGLANRRLAPFVDKAAVGWPQTASNFGAKAVVTGNPVRREIFAVPPATAGDRLRLLVFGGSQGSVPLNRAMVATLSRLASRRESLEIVHQTGPANLEEVRAAYEAAGFPARIEPYIHDMAAAYASCDLVLSRAGATTCAELAAAGRPAVLVPLPAAGAHQRDNALALAEAGAAVMIDQRDLDPQRLAATLFGLMDDPDRRLHMAKAARQLARPDAASAIADLLF